MLSEINSVTLLLQMGNATLADCRMCVDSLLQDVEQYRVDAQSYLYDCRLGKKYLAIDATIAPDTEFEIGCCQDTARKCSRDDRRREVCLREVEGTVNHYG